MGQKILVVEDNELNLKLFCDLLGAHGYAAEPVRDGREALERARAFGPDLVVMDIQMPYISGLELIEQMKADEGLRRTPIMAVTAYAARGDEERIRDAGAEGYVSKPISVIKFVEAVASLLATAAERAAAGPEERSEEQGQADEAPEASAEADDAAEQEPLSPTDGEATAAEESEAEAEPGNSDPARHSRESGNPASDGGGNGEAGEEGKVGPESSPG